MVIRSLNCIKSSTRVVSSRLANRIAISRSGYTTSAPSFSNISPCSALVALAITNGIPIATRFKVVRIEDSIFSPIHTIATSQFCMPVSVSVFLSSVLTTTAFSVYSRISRTLSSSLSITSNSAPDPASSVARAYPNRPRPITPYAIFSFFRLRNIFITIPFGSLFLFIDKKK